MTTKYDLACRLVDKHVLTCVSSLIPALYAVASNGGNDDIEAYHDELANLGSSEDYEEPVCSFIRDDADLDQLEEIVEERGDWEDLLANIGFRQEDLDEACTVADEAVDGAWQAYLAEQEDDEKEKALLDKHNVLVDQRNALPEDLDDWLKLNEGKEKELRELVLLLVEQERDGYREVGQTFDLDPDYNETFEFWVVTTALGDWLKDYGQSVEDVMGLTVWGRGACGQAIALDYVIMRIAFDLWGGEVTESEPADAF